MKQTHSLNKKELTQEIKSRAKVLGFQKVGIIDVSALKSTTQWIQATQHLKNWLDSNYQAEMAWMVNHLEKRLDPASLMEGTQSIVCVGMNYYTPDIENPHPDAVKISKYARGTDYHYVVKDRLKQLLKELQELYPDIQGRALTDSAPILEKVLAEAAGIGWMGKHGNLITQDYGSWLFLGELLLDCKLEYDPINIPNYCGSCTRCIDACPTDAIISSTVVDANQCISYWTIEYKGDEIPKEIAQNMEGWVFGCDICQDVCPWNMKFSQETTEEAFQPRPWNKTPRASEILALDEEQFKKQHHKSPIKRTKLRGLQRNVQAVSKEY